MNLLTWSLCFDGNSKLGVFPCMLMDSSFKNTNDLNGITGLTNVYFSDLGCAVTHYWWSVGMMRKLEIKYKHVSFAIFRLSWGFLSISL